MRDFGVERHWFNKVRVVESRLVDMRCTEVRWSELRWVEWRFGELRWVGGARRAES